MLDLDRCDEFEKWVASTNPSFLVEQPINRFKCVTANRSSSCGVTGAVKTEKKARGQEADSQNRFYRPALPGLKWYCAHATKIC